MIDGPTDEETGGAKVLVFRNQAGEPVAVPEEIVTRAERAYRCYQMRVAAKSWQEIAMVEGFQTAAQAQYDVERYLSEAQALVTENSQRTMLTLEVMRLDSLQSAHWNTAVEGNINAAKLVLDIIKLRTSLVGLDADKAGNTGGAATTVVVPQGTTEDEYVAQMRAVAERSAPAALDSPEE